MSVDDLFRSITNRPGHLVGLRHIAPHHGVGVKILEREYHVLEGLDLFRHLLGGFWIFISFINFYAILILIHDHILVLSLLMLLPQFSQQFLSNLDLILTGFPSDSSEKLPVSNNAYLWCLLNRR